MHYANNPTTMPGTSTKTITIAFRCPNELAQALEAICLETEQTKTELITRLLLDGLAIPSTPLEVKVDRLEEQMVMILSMLTKGSLEQPETSQTTGSTATTEPKSSPETVRVKTTLKPLETTAANGLSTALDPKISPETLRDPRETGISTPEDVFKELVSKGLRATAIASQLNELGYITPKGQLWTRENVNSKIRKSPILSQLYQKG